MRLAIHQKPAVGAVVAAGSFKPSPTAVSACFSSSAHFDDYSHDNLCSNVRPANREGVTLERASTTESESHMRGHLRINYGGDSDLSIGVWDGSPRNEGH